MSQHPLQASRLVPFVLCLLCALTLGTLPRGVAAQDQDEGKGDPVFTDYKGVHIGMSADETRHKLGTPADKSDAQDFYTFSDDETAQVSYDAQHNVAALAIFYVGAGKAPVCKSVLGTELTAKTDGSMYRLVRYPKAGYWVSYSRTAGDSPLVTVMMQRYKP